MFWALDRPPPAKAETKAASVKVAQPAPAETRSPFDRGQGPRPPRAALASFKVPGDLQLELVLAEPIVRQPVSISLRRTGAALGGSVPAISVSRRA